MASIKEYVPAALCYYADHTAGTPLTGAFRVVNFKAYLKAYFGVDVPDDVIESSLDYMVDVGIAQRFSDALTATYYLLDEPTSLDYYNNSNDTASAFTKARLLGSAWIKEALASLASRQQGKDPPIDVSIPASDRVVSLNDNQRSLLVDSLEEIASEVKTSNSVRDALGDDAERLTAELDAGLVLTRADKVRLTALVTVLLKPLKYLTEKFAGGAIGALAGQLIQALLKLL